MTGLSRRSFLKVASLTALAAIVVPEIIVAEIERPRGLVVKQGTASHLYEITVTTPNGGRVIVMRGQPYRGLFLPPSARGWNHDHRLLRVADVPPGGSIIWRMRPGEEIVSNRDLHVVINDPGADIWLLGRDSQGMLVESHND